MAIITHLDLIDRLETFLDVAIDFQLALEHDARNTGEPPTTQHLFNSQ